MNTNAEKKCRLPIFRERLDKLRGEMTYVKFAEKLGLSRATVGFYLSGDRIPNAIELKKIAEQCEVSTDYLLGIVDAANATNHEISSALGLSDNAIQQLRKFSGNQFSKVAFNQILENGKIISYIIKYLFSFLEEERKKSRFRNVPLSKYLATGYADMSLVKLIEFLPIWRMETIKAIKGQPQLLDTLLTEYVCARADEIMCRYEIGEFHDELTDIPENSVPPEYMEDFYSEDFFEIDEETFSAMEEINTELQEKQEAIKEILNLINKKEIKKDNGHNPKTR
nr:helix-turn-helix transcriptional regulator [uncultured Agathobaculum sp.]